MDFTESKIKHLKDLAGICAQRKAEGKKIVLCHGVFDIIHPGHIAHFESAKKYGDILIVTITKDQYVLKGPGRPFVEECLRAKMLSALCIVDYVAMIDSESSVDPIKALKPDFYAKGPDYKDKEKDITGKIYIEEDAVKSAGGELVFTDDEALSATTLIKQSACEFLSEDPDFQKHIQKYKQYSPKMFDEIKVTDKFKRQSDFTKGLELAVELIMFYSSMNRKLIFIGNGGSAAIGSHQAVDYCKNAHLPAITFNDPVVLTAFSNDFGYARVFDKCVKSVASSGDILIAISCSGESKNIINGVKSARDKGCKVITFSGFNPRNTLRESGDINFYVPDNDYGFVETVHAAVNHLICDIISSVVKRQANVQDRQPQTKIPSGQSQSME